VVSVPVELSVERLTLLFLETLSGELLSGALGPVSSCIQAVETPLRSSEPALGQLPLSPRRFRLLSYGRTRLVSLTAWSHLLLVSSELEIWVPTNGLLHHLVKFHKLFHITFTQSTRTQAETIIGENERCRDARSDNREKDPYVQSEVVTSANPILCQCRNWPSDLRYSVLWRGSSD
jgi:hypothetical protein